MSYSWLDAGKDFLGALGPVFIAVPWFSEFRAKRQKQRVASVPTSGPLAEWQQEVGETLSQLIHDPKLRDVVWTLLGLACICASFLIGVGVNLQELLRSG